MSPRKARAFSASTTEATFTSANCVKSSEVSCAAAPAFKPPMRAASTPARSEGHNCPACDASRAAQFHMKKIKIGTQ
eukprot:scaffold29086_cov101-Isochrysis_galbana.AAC.2